MKNLLVAISIILFNTAFAQVFTIPFDANITKENAIQNMEYYVEDMNKFEYLSTKQNEISPSQYELVWSKTDEKGGILRTKISYLFLDREVKIQMFDSIYNIDKIILTIKESDPEPEKKKIYKTNKDIYVDFLKKYLNIAN